jgi:cysteine-rich repeat protein
MYRLSPSRPWAVALALLVALGGAVFSAQPALATVPSTALVQGILASPGGAPVADGTYALTFRLYPSEAAQQPSWEEAAPTVPVAGGRFAHALGSVTPLPAAGLSAADAGWLGIQVGLEPELPRVAVHASLFAQRALVANGLDCSGCITESHLGFGFAASATPGGPATTAVSASFAQNATSADEAAFANVAGNLQCTGCVGVDHMKFDKDVYMGGVTVTAGKFVGDGSGLTNIAGGAAGFTKGFSQVFAGPGGTVIPDNNPIGASESITVPSLGATKAITITVQIENSDLSGVEVALFDPNNSKVTLVELGKGQGAVLSTTFPTQTPFAVGDLSSWVGKDPAGTWTLKVTDDVFLNNNVDGVIFSWSMGFDVDSNTKAKTDTTLVADGGLMLQKSAVPPVPCDNLHAGYAYLDTSSSRIKVCVGWWAEVAFTAVCGNGGQEGAEECDDGNADNTDACTQSCKNAACGDGYVQAGVEECDDGNNDDTDACPATCKNAFCGDGYVQAGVEQCDDGNSNPNDGCDAQCQSENTCTDTGEQKLITVAELNSCLQAVGAAFFNVQYIEVAYGNTSYLDNVCKEFGYNNYSGTWGGDLCNSSAYMYPSYCGQGWKGGGCSNGCGNANYGGFYCN